MSNEPTNSSMNSAGVGGPQSVDATGMSELRPGGVMDLSAAPPKPRKAINSGYAVLLGLLAVSGAMLYGMRRVGMSQGWVNAETKEISLPAESPGQTVTAGQVMTLLANLERKPVQVALERLGNNPFDMTPLLPVAETKDVKVADDGSAGRGAEEAKRKAQERQQAIRKAYEGLALKSVVDGRIPMARINDKSYKVGDEVAEFFVVKHIAFPRVTLDCQGEEYVLTMEHKDKNKLTNTKTGK